MISIYDSAITDVLPEYIKNDYEVQAISYAISNQIKALEEKIKVIQLFNSIDILSEDVLDILAIESRARCYREEYPRDIKVSLIKSSISWYLRSGTPSELEDLCKNIYGGGTIEEWFDYSGNPYHFRVGVDVTETRLDIDIDGIKKIIEKYKRASARLEEIILQCSIKCSVYTKTDCFIFFVERTGKVNAGEIPYINTVYACNNENVSVKSYSDDYIYKSDNTGTNPYRNTIGNVISDNIKNLSSVEIYGYDNDNIGTIPGRNTSSVIRNNNIKADASKDNFRLLSDNVGSDQCGINPNFNILGKTDDTSVNTEIESENNKYTSYNAGMCNAGESPYRNTTADGESGGLVNKAESEEFSYKVKRCGTRFCNRK